MRVAIHQPEHLPWGGFFEKARQADLLVLLDDVQFAKGNVQNRARILANGSLQWLTVPVVQAGRMSSQIRYTQIAETSWRERYLRTLESAYGKAPHFGEIYEELKFMVDSRSSGLADLNSSLIALCFEILGIPTPIVHASSLGVTSSGPQRLADLAGKVGADTYLSGAGGRSYLRNDPFDELGISVEYGDFTANDARSGTRWGAPSAIHHLMLHGRSAARYWGSYRISL